MMQPSLPCLRDREIFMNFETKTFDLITENQDIFVGYNR
jgi:hypothetical protein